jgi:hypothetical protein
MLSIREHMITVKIIGFRILLSFFAFIDLSPSVYKNLEIFKYYYLQGTSSRGYESKIKDRI